MSGTTECSAEGCQTRLRLSDLPGSRTVCMACIRAGVNPMSRTQYRKRIHGRPHHNRRTTEGS